MPHLPAESGSSVVKNPVNPAENFADKWTMSKYSHLKLRENFVLWATQARADFYNILKSHDSGYISDAASQRLALAMDTGRLSKAVGLTSSPAVIVPKTHQIKSGESKPWRRNTGV